jgi:hypothetical protein
MGPYDLFRKAPLEQLRRWWSGNDPPPPGHEEDYVDEVAHALSHAGPTGVAVLRQALNSHDVGRRWAAVYFLATEGLADEEVRAALRRAFDAPEPLKTAALWGFLNLNWFPLKREEVERLLHQEDQRLAALAMCYLSRAFPGEAVGILRSALGSDNPRMREYACDEVGEREIVELKGELERLVADPDEYVAQAARINSFLNRRTGEIEGGSDEVLAAAEDEEEDEGMPEWEREMVARLREVLASDDWIPLPRRDGAEDYRIMEDFCLERCEGDLQDELLTAIRGRGAFRCFKDAVRRRRIEGEWYAFRQAQLAEWAAEWLDAEGIEYRDDLEPKRRGNGPQDPQRG